MSEVEEVLHMKWQDQLRSDCFLPYCSHGASARRRKRKVGVLWNGLLYTVKPNETNELLQSSQSLMWTTHIPSEMCALRNLGQRVNSGSLSSQSHRELPLGYYMGFNWGFYWSWLDTDNAPSGTTRGCSSINPWVWTFNLSLPRPDFSIWPHPILLIRLWLFSFRVQYYMALPWFKLNSRSWEKRKILAL